LIPNTPERGRQAEALTIMREFDRLFLGARGVLLRRPLIHPRGKVEEGVRRVLFNVEERLGNVRFLTQAEVTRVTSRWPRFRWPR
jgi:hypothetical protein